MIIFGPDPFTVGANANIDAYPATPDYAYSRGSGTDIQVNAANDNVQAVGAGDFKVARCIDSAIPANMLDQEVRGSVRTANTDGIIGAAVRYSSSTRGYTGFLYTTTANEVRIEEDNAGFTLLASADRGLVAGVTYPISFRATGPTNNTVLTLIINNTEAVIFTDTTSVTGSPGIYFYRDGALPQANVFFDDFLVDDLAPIAIVQSASASVAGVNNTTLAFPSNVTAGNWIGVTIAAFRSGGCVIQTPTDTRGHTYVAMTAQNGPTTNIALRSYYVENISGGPNTVTYDLDGTLTGEISVTASEFSGVKTTSSLHASNLLTGISGTQPSSGNITPSVTGCLLYAGATCTNNNTAFTEEATWTRLQQQQPAALLGVYTECKVGTTSLEDADWTISPASSWAAHVAAFLPATITGAGAPTLAADTLVATGTSGGLGTGDVQEAADTLLAAGTVAVNAAGTIQEAADTLLAAGQAAIAGAGELLHAPDTAAGTGTVTSGVYGEGAITLGPDTLAALATAAIIGQASITELAAVIAAAGTVFGPVQSVIAHGKGINEINLVLAPLTAGNMIHVEVVTFQSTAGTTIVTPIDTLGHVYQPVAVQQNSSANTVHLRTWYVPGCSAGANSITAKISGTGLGEITACASEWPGRDQSSPLSGTPSLSGPVNTAAPATGDMLPSHNGALMIGTLNADGVPVTITEEAGWNLLREYEGTDSSVTLSVVWKLQPTATLDGASWTLGSSRPCLALVSAYRPAGVPGITGVGAIVLGPDTTVQAPGARSRMMLMGVGG